MVGLTDSENTSRTEELLALKKAPEALTCHDEMQFQIVHQAHELYMKLVEHELRFVATLLSAGEHAAAGTRARAGVEDPARAAQLDRVARYDGADRLHDDSHRARSRLGSGVARVQDDAAV